VTVTEVRLGISLDVGCGFGGENAVPLLEQMSSGKYDLVSVLEIPRDIDEWRSEHNTARKRANRAYRRGYVTEDLGFTGGTEWDAINRSAPFRQGRPMSAGYLNPTQFSRLPDYPCPVHATRVSGCYDPDGGLVAYLVMLRAGDLALVSQILGHADVLKDEIMFPLFQHALARETHTPGLVVYNRHDSGLPTLTRFKEWFGFEERQVEWLP
jgi:hypothetical protein